MARLRVAIYQYRARAEAASRRIARLARAVADLCDRHDADLVICPELFTCGYNIGAAVGQRAESIDGASAAALAQLAAETGTALLTGYAERAGTRLFNAALCVGKDGEVLANHRKLHLPNAFEQRYFEPGSGLTRFTLNGVEVAVLICYDVEFPEAARAASRAGAQLIAVPTALREQYRHVARNLIPTRAFENGVFVAYANYAGVEGDWRYCGASCIVGPDGHDLARAGSGEAVIAATLDTAAIARARAAIPYLEHRRDDLD